jgi:sulfate adenylyltransferase subunit 1
MNAPLKHPVPAAFTGQEVQAAVRIMTAGSVDDGKSTLIGRLMFDLDQITDDQLTDLRAASLRSGRGELDLSLYTDGLSAEREQGITIDVAYRYLRHGNRSFILCDSPGHEQYTRNMVCAASQADLALIMVDARQGPTRQTLRHLRIAQWLRVPQILFVVNKLDLIGFSEAAYNSMAEKLIRLAGPSNLVDVMPVVALDGDQIVRRNPEHGRLSWYKGPTLLERFESAASQAAFRQDAPLRFTVQRVMRPTGHQDASLHDFRALSGRVESGEIRVGQQIRVISGTAETRLTRVQRIHTYDGDLQQAAAGRCVNIVLEDDVDASRGDTLVDEGQELSLSRTIQLQACWVSDKPARVGQRILVKQGARSVVAKIDSIDSKLDLESGTLQPDHNPGQQVELNEIALLTLSLAQAIQTDDYQHLPRTGSMLILDPLKYDTLGVGIH